jgi:large subunit ribosomal protein L4
MMELKLIDKNGKAAKKGVTVSEGTFCRDFNEALVHQVVVAYMANARTATRAQKGRDNVAHTTHKPYAQIGTGNDRAGMTSSPIWRGGGRAFPNSPNENFSHKVNRKAYRAGMQTILSELVRQERLSVVEEFSVDTPKTKALAEKIKGMGYAEGVLVLTDSFNENLYLSSRNLTNVMVVEAQYADPVSLVRFPNVVATAGAVKKLEEMLAS